MFLWIWNSNFIVFCCVLCLFSLPTLYDIAHLSSGLRCFRLEVFGYCFLVIVPLHNVSFSTSTFKIFLFVTDFHQYDYDVPWGSSLFVDPAWILLSYFSLWVYGFDQIRRNKKDHSFFELFLQLFFLCFWNYNYT